jgi:aspartyl-tRNA(Asn)/glutamyl-tRNA(Gln) amidotransferase subunit B
MYYENKTPTSLISELEFKQIVDDESIKSELLKIINDNKQMVSQYEDRPERVEKFFIGLLMKNTKGQVNPLIANKILKELLNNFAS